MSETFASSGEQYSPRATEVKNRPLDVDDYAAQADYISLTVAREEDPVVGRQLAHKEYVENEENPELQKFGKMMLIAEKAAEQSQIINNLKAKEVDGYRLSPAEAGQRQRSVRIVCAYNQMLEAMISENEEAMPKQQMTEWLKRASGNGEWAAMTMSGVGAEIAAKKLLTEVPDIEELAHGDLDQDMDERDFVFAPTAMGINSIDVKTGMTRPKLPVTHSKLHSDTLILSLNPEHLNKTGYEIDEKYVPAYVDELRNKL